MPFISVGVWHPKSAFVDGLVILPGLTAPENEAEPLTNFLKGNGAPDDITASERNVSTRTTMKFCRGFSVNRDDPFFEPEEACVMSEKIHGLVGPQFKTNSDICPDPAGVINEKSRHSRPAKDSAAETGQIN